MKTQAVGREFLPWPLSQLQPQKTKKLFPGLHQERIVPGKIFVTDHSSMKYMDCKAFLMICDICDSHLEFWISHWTWGGLNMFEQL